MNRTQRRAFARIKKLPFTRELLGAAKHTHKLASQVCALWVPAARGYVEYFSPTGFRVVEDVALARCYDETEACSAALAFREITDLRVVIRPVYLHQVTH